MKYINKLQYENKKQAAEIVGLKAMIQNIKEYLQSEKFWIDNSVNVNDILSRIQEGENFTQLLIDKTSKPVV